LKISGEISIGFGTKKMPQKVPETLDTIRKRHKNSASVRKNYMTLRYDLAPRFETIIDESGIDLNPIHNRVPDKLKNNENMKILLNQLIHEANEYD